MPFAPKLRYTWLVLVLAALVALVVAACGDDDSTSSTATAPAATAPASPTTAAAAFPVTIKDSTNTSVTLESAPTRVISYSAGITETLYAVGAGPQVVAVDQFSDYPPEAQKLPQLDYTKPAPEPAVGLKPDLIFMGSNQAQQVAAFRGLGLKVLMFDEPSTIDGVIAQVKTIGQATGHAESANALADKLTSRVAAVKTRTATVTNGPMVFFEVTEDGYTSGPNSFIGSMLTLVHARNVAADAKTDFPQLNSEVIIAANPDVILLSDGGNFGGQTPDTVKARAGWQNINAVKNGRVVVVDPSVFTRPGPRIVDALEQLVTILYPTLK